MDNGGSEPTSDGQEGSEAVTTTNAGDQETAEVKEKEGESITGREILPSKASMTQDTPDSREGTPKDSAASESKIKHWSRLLRCRRGSFSIAKSRRWETNELSDAARRRWRIVAFITAFIAACGAFQMWSFSEYLFSLKVLFNFTQFQVDLMMAFNFLGFAATFPAGVLVHRYGLRLTALIGFATVTTFYPLLWWASYLADFYSQHPGLFGTFFFLAGCGCGTNYIVAVVSTVRNFSARHRALVASILASAFNIGPMFYTITYEAVFKETTGPKGPNRLTDYFMFVALTVSLSSLLALLTLGDYLPSNENSFHILLPNLTFGDLYGSQENITSKSTTAGDKPNRPDAEEVEKDQTKSEEFHMEESDQLIGNIIEDKDLLLVLSTAQFHLIFWPSIILIGVKGMIIGNVLVYLDDFDVEEYASWIPFMTLGVSVVHKVLMGYISDRFLYLFPRAWFMLMAAVFGMMGFILAMLTLHNLIGVLAVILLWTLSAETVPAIAPVILLDDHGMKTFSRTVGLLFTGGSFVIFVGQLWVSNTYSWASNLTVTEATCPTIECFLTTFITGLIFCSLAGILLIVYIIIQCRNRRNWTNYDAL